MKSYRFLFLFLSSVFVMGGGVQDVNTWTGIWATAAEFTGPGDMPQTTSLSNTSYNSKGEAKPQKALQTYEKLEHWYNITKIGVPSEGRKAIAVLGNSITDGRGTTTNLQNRWPDIMAEALNEIQNGVFNLGIGGNCVVEGGLSQPALVRFDRDILGLSG